MSTNDSEDFLRADSPERRTGGQVGRGGPARLGPTRGKSVRERLDENQARQRAIDAADPVARARRLRLDDRSTDKTYRSAEVSALRPSGAEKPQAGRFRRSSPLDERNTDRYYRDSLIKAPTRQQVQRMKQQGPQSGLRRPPNFPADQDCDTQGSVTRPARHGQHVHPVVVASKEDIPGAVHEALVRLGSGVRVLIDVEASLALRLGGVLDSMVGREEISEDQRRDIVLRPGKLTTGVEKLASVEDFLQSSPRLPARTDRDVNPEAFLAGEEGLEDDGELPPEQEVFSDDDDDFLEQPALTQTTQPDKADPVAPPAQPAPAPPPANNPQRGKRKRKR